MESEGSPPHLSTLYNVYILNILTLTLQYDDYIIYCTYNILLSAQVVYGIVLLEITLHPLSIYISQALLCNNLLDSMSLALAFQVKKLHDIWINFNPLMVPVGLTHSQPNSDFHSSKAFIQLYSQLRAMGTPTAQRLCTSWRYYTNLRQDRDN
jgi:hypothetical protein